MVGLSLALLLSLGALPTSGGSCDLIEINHYMPECGNGFTQLIAWDWCPQYHRWHAQQWLIVRDWQRAGRVVSCEGDGTSVRVSARLFRETWAKDDPERENQKLFPINERRVVWR
jgi:hypothetical protein